MVKNEDDEAGFIVPKCEAPEESLPETRYHELQERIKKSEGRIAELEAEIGTLNSEYDELKVKYEALEIDKLALFGALKAREGKVEERRSAASKTIAEAGKEVQGTFVDLTGMEMENGDDEDELFQLKAKNVTLEHEKEEAENDARVWKQMYHELKLSLGSSFAERTAEDGNTPDISGTSGSKLERRNNSIIGGHRSRVLDNREARRSLFIEEERNPIGKMAPSRPMDPKPSCPAVINLDDSDDEPEGEMDVNRDEEKANENSPECCLEDDMDVGFDTTTPRTSTSKRKRALNMVTSDSETESDDEDNIPLCKWKVKRFSNVSSDANGSSKAESPLENGDDDTKESVTPRRRRLKRMSQCEQRLDAQHETGVPTTKDDDAEEIESEKDGSESSGDSMKEFIVESSSDVSDGSADGFHQDDASSDSSEEADCNSQMHGILSRLRRTKDQKFKWEFDGDMLADFGKDSELCMRAVCVLYRQQTSDEQVSKEALHVNGRGFSKSDAYRGTEIGRFLTGGDPSGDMIKSVEELEAHDSNGVNKCRELAFKYAKQLFQIYQNEEDRFFSPSADNK